MYIYIYTHILIVYVRVCIYRYIHAFHIPTGVESLPYHHKVRKEATLPGFEDHVCVCVCMCVCVCVDVWMCVCARVFQNMTTDPCIEP